MSADRWGLTLRNCSVATAAIRFRLLLWDVVLCPSGTMFGKHGKVVLRSRFTCSWAHSFVFHSSGSVCRQFVAAVLVVVSRMPAYVQPGYIVVTGEFVQQFPQVTVRHCVSVAGSPVIPFPAGEEFGDPSADIFRVRDDRHGTGSLQCAQSFDRGSQLHPVIGRVCYAALQHSLLSMTPQYASPTAGTRISEAAPIRRDFHFAHGLPPDRDGPGTTRCDPSGSHLATNSKSCSPAQARMSANDLKPAPALDQCQPPLFEMEGEQVPATCDVVQRFHLSSFPPPADCDGYARSFQPPRQRAGVAARTTVPEQPAVVCVPHPPFAFTAEHEYVGVPRPFTEGSGEQLPQGL